MFPLRRPLSLSGAALVALTAGVALAPAAWTVADVRAAPPAPHVRFAGYRAGQRFSYAPRSRTVRPVRVFRARGDIARPKALLSGRSTRIAGQGARLTLDFGREVGGHVTLHIAASSRNPTLGVAFSESSLYAGPQSDASNGSTTGNTDGSAPVTVSGHGAYRLPAKYLRGGFRYLTVFLETAGTVRIDGITVHVTAAPDLHRLNRYPDYFYSSDPLLNRIWYAGAWTVELDTIPHHEARGSANSGWNNTADLKVPGSALTDGAKRDRAIWAGDLLISALTDDVSLHDMRSVAHSLDGIYALQNPDGAFPFEGPPTPFGVGEASDPYHLDALIATADYVLLTRNFRWLDGHWSQYVRGLRWAMARLNPSNGAFVVVGSEDWARTDQGGENIEANALMYRVLTSCRLLATDRRDPALARTCRGDAARLKRAVNTDLWVSRVGAYQDDPTGSQNPPGTPLYPQDGNALAVWYGLVEHRHRARRVLAHLRRDWTRIGARTPEWDGGRGVHPFPGGMEVMARFAAGRNRSALALIRREWGYMLRTAIGTHSTFWEGFHTNGSFANYYNGSYPASYTSLAHGWSTGPTTALTEYLLGAMPDLATGGYDVMPHPGGVRHAEGTLTTATGRIRVGWTWSSGGFALRVVARAKSLPPATVVVPCGRGCRSITVNGRPAWDGRHFLGAAGIRSAGRDGRYVRFSGVTPGARTFAW